MAKAARSLFVCQNCGAVAPRWTGKCAACGEWNTIVEEAQAAAVPGTGLAKSSKGRAAELRLLADTDGDKLERMPTGLAELDRVTGGGIVPGSALLIGGEPGIGKSTLLLQVAAALARAGGAPSTSRARKRPPRCVCAPNGWAFGRARGARGETSLSNILATLGEGTPAGSRRHRFHPDAMGRRASRRRREPSARCAPRRRR